MLIFGGETTDGTLQSTMWRFDLGKKVMQYERSSDITSYLHCNLSILL